MNCTHENWTAKEVPLSNGRPSLREFCTLCGRSNNGSNLGFALPMIADADVLVMSYKYQGKTLGEIAEIDKSYLLWLVLKSKASDRVKKSAARLYYGVPYVPPKDGDNYSQRKCYDPTMGAELVTTLQKNENM